MQLYKIAVRATGGNIDVMANYLLVMLSQSANTWLMGLGEDSIKSWDDLKKVFVENYMATCQQPSMKYDQEKLHQTSGEPLRSYIRRFSETRNTIHNIGDSEPSSLSPEDSIIIRSCIPNITTRGPRPSANSSRLQTRT